MRSYKILKRQIFQFQKYSIVPIRWEDRYLIMKWRNEQVYHLRQNKPLTEEDQDKYFNDVVAQLFDQDQPDQVLFSYLEGEKCIGYGGLVHINWLDNNAEISFLLNTSLEKDYFEFHWSSFLTFIEQVAFEELELHKIYTYAFDLRPRLYSVLENNGFTQEAFLKEHSFFDGQYINVLIHSKLHQSIMLREAAIDDIEITYKWANNKTIRAFAYNKSQIAREEHNAWFKDKLKSDACIYFILEINNKAAGSIRFDIEQDQHNAKINYLVDQNYTGKGYGTYLVEKGVAELLNTRPTIVSVYGFVLKENLASIKIFKKLGYKITFESETELKFEKKLQ